MRHVALQWMATLVAADTVDATRATYGVTASMQSAVLSGLLGAALLVLLVLLVVFLVRAESWDQRRFRLWVPAHAGGGRRSTDRPLLEVTAQGPFRRKPMNK